MTTGHRSPSRSRRSSSSSSSSFSSRSPSPIGRDSDAYEYGPLFDSDKVPVTSLPVEEQDALVKEQRLCNLRNMVRLERKKAHLLWDSHRELERHSRSMERDIRLMNEERSEWRKRPRSPTPPRLRYQSPPPQYVQQQQQQQQSRFIGQQPDAFDAQQAAYMRGDTTSMRTPGRLSSSRSKKRLKRPATNQRHYSPPPRRSVQQQQPQQQKRREKTDYYSPEVPAFDEPEERLVINTPMKKKPSELVVKDVERVVRMDHTAKDDDIPAYDSCSDDQCRL